jgi:hypothetical protein
MQRQDYAVEQKVQVTRPKAWQNLWDFNYGDLGTLFRCIISEGTQSLRRNSGNPSPNWGAGETLTLNTLIGFLKKKKKKVRFKLILKKIIGKESFRHADVLVESKKKKMTSGMSLR